VFGHVRAIDGVGETVLNLLHDAPIVDGHLRYNR
jgi:hypothetical protein